MDKLEKLYRFTGVLKVELLAPSKMEFSRRINIMLLSSAIAPRSYQIEDIHIIDENDSTEA